MHRRRLRRERWNYRTHGYTDTHRDGDAARNRDAERYTDALTDYRTLAHFDAVPQRNPDGER